MTGRDINGAICMTRSGELASMCGTFSYSTHYVPFVNYCGENNMGLLEGTYLAMRHELKLGEDDILVPFSTKDDEGKATVWDMIELMRV